MKYFQIQKLKYLKKSAILKHQSHQFYAPSKRTIWLKMLRVPLIMPHTTIHSWKLKAHSMCLQLLYIHVL
jgi:hypothetical protein